MREMQIKTSVRHYFILFMMAVLKKKQKITNVGVSLVVQWLRICLAMQGTLHWV